ncbi:hypothetical protein BJ742DRAFT_323970 [Cladochytrium replicatum]|nr:hypothetical protein BJ742DRAFT_323970 [Cladochytrium replicatum]
MYSMLSVHLPVISLDMLALMEETREPPLVVSFGPNGWFVRYANHSPLNHSLPPTLHNKLSTRADESSPVVGLSMSADEVWFAKFEDGSTSWSGIFDNEGWDRLQELEHDVTLVAFAPGSGYLIHTDDGTAIYKGLPQQLAELLDAETERERKIKAKKENPDEEQDAVPPLRSKPSLSFIPQAPPTRRLSRASMYGLLGQYQATPSGLFFMLPHAPQPTVAVSPTSYVASNSFNDHVDEPGVREYRGRPIKFLSVSGSGIRQASYHKTPLNTHPPPQQLKRKLEEPHRARQCHLLLAFHERTLLGLFRRRFALLGLLRPAVPKSNAQRAAPPWRRRFWLQQRVHRTACVLPIRRQRPCLRCGV